jgi:pimeloyl-ACP methyl ester carboxylesterase
MHVLESGFESKGRPCVLLLHGFPELAFSWRKVMPALAEAGYHVIAPDQRGYGRTTGWDASFDGDLTPFRLTNLVRDALGVVSAFGHRSVAAVVGHDFGSSIAAWCALIRPDVFRSVVLMSAPFAGPPPLAFDMAAAPPPPKREDPVHRELAGLPRPRKHYQWYYSTREANADMWHASQGVHDFLRAYYHHKSADWKGNKPTPLQSWSADELAKLPTYYVMDFAKNMAETVAEEMPSQEEVAAARWLTDQELAFYSAEYQRTGFQGGLQWYRCGTSGAFNAELETWSGRRIDVPSCFISGRQDWGTYQRPGVFETMQKTACTRMLGCHLVDGAGHWVQQEQASEVSRLLLQFLGRV